MSVTPRSIARSTILSASDSCVRFPKFIAPRITGSGSVDDVRRTFHGAGTEDIAESLYEGRRVLRGGERASARSDDAFPRTTGPGVARLCGVNGIGWIAACSFVLASCGGQTV